MDTVALGLFGHFGLQELSSSAGVLYCFNCDIYGIKQVAKEFQDELIWRQYGFDSELFHQLIRRFFIDFLTVAKTCVPDSSSGSPTVTYSISGPAITRTTFESRTISTTDGQQSKR